ncbi:MAG: hypothetical protein IPP87_07445 [Ideonella sp.]|nr:hypothetical protein [Ideonella sp.]MBL0148561.1 hypothetical protein [Ideonella sp.]
MNRLLLATWLVLTLAACGGGSDDEAASPTMTTLPVNCAASPSTCR